MSGTYTKLYYHIVFSTKERREFINPEIETELQKYIAGIVRGIKGTCIEINGMTDHLHILAILPPTIAISDALRTIKSNSSKWIHEKFRELRSFSWQDGYSAFTVSQSQLGTLQAYIRNQKTHHASRDFKTELVAILERHGVEYDERYIWD